MVDFFDTLYSSIKNKNLVLSKIKVYSLLRFAVRFTANILIPAYYKLSVSNNIYSIKGKSNGGRKVIVSLTTFPKRAGKLWIVIESLLRQTYKPDKIIVWLSKEQFTNASIPSNLLKYKDRGVEIRLCKDDLRSHKKYYYVLQEFPDDYIVTVDDDVMYHSKLLQNLIELNQNFPDAICCNRAVYISTNDNDLEPYLKWKNITNAQPPSINVLPVGMGGILYPPKSLHKDVLNADVFKKICFHADDIWLNAMALLQNTKMAKSTYNSAYLPIMYVSNMTLHNKNVTEGLNDKQIAGLRKHYKLINGIDPYESIINDKEYGRKKKGSNSF